RPVTVSCGGFGGVFVGAVAVVRAWVTRLRPVLMTAGAMMIGMFPMALGLGEGGEQNAPLGRAVIGGVIVATLATLLFVPVVFSLLRSKGAAHNEAEEEEAAEENHANPSLAN